MSRVAWAQSVTPIPPPTSAHPTFRFLAYAGRPESASPAVGSYGKHKERQAALVKEAFEV